MTGLFLAYRLRFERRKGESYSPLAGFIRQYELIYILGDERDLIGLRTKHRGDDVYLYRSVATPAQAQEMFVSVMNRVNKLTVSPEFLQFPCQQLHHESGDHVNQVSPNRVRFGWKVLLPGLSAEYAYDLGLLDSSVPFDKLTELALIDGVADTTSSDFSKAIRSR